LLLFCSSSFFASVDRCRYFQGDKETPRKRKENRRNSQNLGDFCNARGQRTVKVKVIITTFALAKLEKYLW